MPGTTITRGGLPIYRIFPVMSQLVTTRSFVRNKRGQLVTGVDLLLGICALNVYVHVLQLPPKPFAIIVGVVIWGEGGGGELTYSPENMVFVGTWLMQCYTGLRRGMPFIVREGKCLLVL